MKFCCLASDGIVVCLLCASLQEETYLPSGTVLDLQQLLPSNTSYLAYSGSLTTPPCTEGVLWMVMANAQKVSKQQVRTQC